MKKLLLVLSFMSIFCLNLLNFNVGFAAEHLDSISSLSTTDTIMLAEASSDETTAAPTEATEPAPVLSEGNTAWMIVATVLVIMMSIPGIALFYGGLVRSKNMLSVLMQVFVTFSLISIIWVAFGYSLALTEVASSAKLTLVIPKKFRHKKLINAKVDNNFFIIVSSD